MTAKLPYQPTKLTERRSNLKTSFVIKSNILVPNYNKPYQIMNNVSVHGTLTTKESLNTHFAFFCLLYSPVGSRSLSLSLRASVNQNIWTPFPTAFLSIWEISWWNLSPCSSETAPLLLGKNPKGNAENTVSVTCYTNSKHCLTKISATKFHCNFPLFRVL